MAVNDLLFANVPLRNNSLVLRLQIIPFQSSYTVWSVIIYWDCQWQKCCRMQANAIPRPPTYGSRRSPP